MIDLISKIFESAGIEKKSNTDFNVYILKEQKNYWVVSNYDGDKINNVLNDQIELFVKAKELIQEPTFDKNVNLLILNKVEKLGEINFDNLLQIEENPYHFKKSILYYTAEELVNLNAKIGESDILPAIELLILKDQIFEKHKTDFDTNSFESLLYRMVIKIPIIKIKITQTNNLKSLEEINKQSIGENLLDEILEQDFFNLNDEDFRSMTTETILEKLKPILPNEAPQN
ncbi:ABC-three component system middle component 1 [uncultured Chryseobacterium sp.]|uniref:ABC-three component system middle component 1 n=1 Tax=uncultured Chryseobacterium sp. TaxID=259322 RepID=UPI0025E262B4|nr:ABC-three component system middle component 1 [uncultured Chryseobacterium sp.]